MAWTYKETRGRLPDKGEDEFRWDYQITLCILVATTCGYPQYSHPVPSNPLLSGEAVKSAGNVSPAPTAPSTGYLTPHGGSNSLSSGQGPASRPQVSHPVVILPNVLAQVQQAALEHSASKSPAQAPSVVPAPSPSFAPAPSQSPAPTFDQVHVPAQAAAPGPSFAPAPSQSPAPTFDQVHVPTQAAPAPIPIVFNSLNAAPAPSPVLFAAPAPAVTHAHIPGPALLHAPIHTAGPAFNTVPSHPHGLTQLHVIPTHSAAPFHTIPTHSGVQFHTIPHHPVHHIANVPTTLQVISPQQHFPVQVSSGVAPVLLNQGGLHGLNTHVAGSPALLIIANDQGATDLQGGSAALSDSQGSSGAAAASAAGGSSSQGGFEGFPIDHGPSTSAGAGASAPGGGGVDFSGSLGAPSSPSSLYHTPGQ
ncbi:cyclin-dependent kinase inhibitor 1C-like [Macrobrachium nipponense]|uniref:cyclin-dependent kinase inhibitor 1C-like n=1 Tax=Macrobrachium nipponense TaxID=159736 RepID=UPI0030C87B25